MSPSTKLGVPEQRRPFDKLRVIPSNVEGRMAGLNLRVLSVLRGSRLTILWKNSKSHQVAMERAVSAHVTSHDGALIIDSLAVRSRGARVINRSEPVRAQ